MYARKKRLRAWQTVFRYGVLPHYPDAALEALFQGLILGDPRIIQKATTRPNQEQFLNGPCEGACVLAYGLWRGLGLATAREVESAWLRLCSDADAALGEPGAVRFLISAWDDMPREEAMKEFAREVEREMGVRGLLLVGA